jgi:hypothetical protein
LPYSVDRISVDDAGLAGACRPAEARSGWVDGYGRHASADKKNYYCHHGEFEDRIFKSKDAFLRRLRKGKPSNCLHAATTLTHLRREEKSKTKHLREGGETASRGHPSLQIAGGPGRTRITPRWGCELAHECRMHCPRLVGSSPEPAARVFG